MVKEHFYVIIDNQPSLGKYVGPSTELGINTLAHYPKLMKECLFNDPIEIASFLRHYAANERGYTYKRVRLTLEDF